VRNVQLPTDVGGEKNHASYKLLQNWIENVANIHAKKKSTALAGMQPQDLEKLMAEWPEQMDQVLSSEEVFCSN
jgi:hypothetical protein